MRLSTLSIETAKGVDLVAFIGRHVPLKRTGSRFVGLCPFHAERSPSFFVHPTKGFKCFGCGAGGSNAIDFLMQHEGIDFVEAVLRVCACEGFSAVEEGPLPAPKTYRAQHPLPPVEHLPAEAILKNLEAYRNNHLYTFLATRFTAPVADHLCEMFGVGSCGWLGDGTTLFVQVDRNGRARQLKAVLFDPQSGARSKVITPRIIGKAVLARWTGRNPDEVHLRQCFCNERALSERPTDRVALVESEKTAMVANVYYPSLVWLATGGSFGCSWYDPEVCRVLRGRRVLLFPDLDAEAAWMSKAPLLEQHTGAPVTVARMRDILDLDRVPRGAEKFDLADWLLMQVDSCGLALTGAGYPACWDYKY